MNKQHRLLFLIFGLVSTTIVALWLGLAAPRAYANVTLTDFKATSKPGVKEVYVYWETSTEMDTVGFFVTRKDTLAGSFDVVSEFFPHEDSSGLVGAQYYFTDTDPALNLNQTYYYRLEEITPNDPVSHGPVTVTVGISATLPPPATNTSTPTPTRTPTSSPTATSAPQSNTTAGSTVSSDSAAAATPRVVIGETVTPLPTLGSNSSAPVVVTTPLANVPDSQPQPQTVATPLPAAPNEAVATAAPPPVVGAVAQAPDPTLVPTNAGPAIVEPAVVVTEAAPVAAPAESTSGSALLLVAAAFLFLGLAFVILRQVRH